MTSRKKLFQTCAKILSGEISASANSTATRFLSSLGYTEPAPETVGNKDHRQQLLILATRFTDAFFLPNDHAPGMHFFGGRIKPSDFGISSPLDKIVSVSGKGTTSAAAFESCIGEACEYLSMIEHENDPLIFPAESGQILDSRLTTWCAAELNVDAKDVKNIINWTRVHPGTSTSVQWLPSELILRRPPHQQTGNKPAGSNGLGAGISMEMATRAALLELIERDAVMIWWHRQQTAPAPASELLDHVENSFPGIIPPANSSYKVWFFDLTCDTGIAVFAALSSTGENSILSTGFSANFDPARALVGALVELKQAELGQALEKAKSVNPNEKNQSDQIDGGDRITIGNFPMLHPGSVSTTSREIPCYTTTAECFTHLETIGCPVYCADITRKEPGVPVVKLLSPGLQAPDLNWMTPRLQTALAVNRHSTSGLKTLPSLY